MAGKPFDPDDDLRAPVPAEILARARRVGPDLDLGSEPGAAAGAELPRDGYADDEDEPESASESESEPWNVPQPPPPAPRLREQTVDDALARIRDLTLAQARAFLKAYLAIPRSELDVGGWAQGFGPPMDAAADRPSLDEIVKGRAALREGALREARANGAELDPDPVAARASDAVVDALSHASLRGGGIEEATVAAEVAAQDVAVALTLRTWISDWRFQELVEPWVRAFSVVAVEAHAFDILGAIAVALGVMALFSFGLGRSSVTAADAPTLVFAALAVLVVVLRWRMRRQSPAG